MLEQKTGCIIVAVVYIRRMEIETRYSIISGDKCVRSMVLSLVEYVADVDIVLVILSYSIHRPASHCAVVIAGKQPNFLGLKIFKIVYSLVIWDSCGVIRSLF